MTDNRLTADELVSLVSRVFQPREEDLALAILVDLPDDEVEDNPQWKERRALAAGWVRELAASRADHSLDVSLFLYPNVHSNNADLPAMAWPWSGDTVPDHIQDMTGQPEPGNIRACPGRKFNRHLGISHTLAGILWEGYIRVTIHQPFILFS